MLSINFTALKTELPELARSWDMLELWLHAHQGARVISPAAVARYVKKEMSLSWEDVINLALALDALAKKGELRRLFAVEASTGQLLHPYYASLSEIPKRVRGRFEEWVDVKDAEIKPVFVGADDDV